MAVVGGMAGIGFGAVEMTCTGPAAELPGMSAAGAACEIAGTEDARAEGGLGIAFDERFEELDVEELRDEEVRVAEKRDRTGGGEDCATGCRVAKAVRPDA